jgi:hypothetical protein
MYKDCVTITVPNAIADNVWASNEYGAWVTAAQRAAVGEVVPFPPKA